MADEDVEKKPVRSPEELRQSLELCEKRRRTLKGDKKASVKDYNEQLADVEAEIGDILTQLEG